MIMNVEQNNWKKMLNKETQIEKVSNKIIKRP